LLTQLLIFYFRNVMGLYYLSVARTDDPDLHWEGGDYSGNIPKPIVNIPVGLLGCASRRGQSTNLDRLFDLPEGR
jgi:hypothetical protein